LGAVTGREAKPVLPLLRALHRLEGERRVHEVDRIEQRSRTGPGAAEIEVDVLSLGSNRSSFSTSVIAVSNPNTPAPRKNSESVRAGGGTQYVMRPRPAESRTREKGYSIRLTSARLAMKMESTPTP